MDSIEIGVVGGSGLYSLANQKDLREVEVDTPFGAPSGPYRVGMVAGRKVAFLARHGAGHRISPSESSAFGACSQRARWEACGRSSIHGTSSWSISSSIARGDGWGRSSARASSLT